MLSGCGGDDEAETTDGPASFGYSGSEGPAHWASLDPAYEACSAGRRQSPIRLTHGEPATLPRIDFGYRPAELELENNGHSVEAEYPPGSSIEIAGTEYALIQFHFHAPSEHRFDGEPLPLELHFVHEADDGTIAVLGVLARKGSPNPAFSELVRALPDEEGHSLPVEEPVNAQDLLPQAPGSAPRWSYDGSLTTPPCTEGVRWEVFDDPIEMSGAQIDRYAAVYDDTNRPLQPLNDRRVLVGD